MSRKSPLQPGENPPKPDNNPWQILVMAALFFAPSIFLTQIPGGVIGPGAMVSGRGQTGQRVSVPMSPEVVHFFGCLGVGFSVLLVIFYFRVRKAIREGR